MKRNRGDLEKEACGDGDEREDKKPVGRAAACDKLEAAVEGVSDFPNAGAAGKAVEQRETVGEDAGAEAAEEQIFEGGFVGALFAAEIAHKDVETEGHGFEAEEHHDQVAAGGHEDHADAGEEEERVVFAFLLAFKVEIADGKQNDQASGGEKYRGEEERVGVDNDGILKAEKPWQVGAGIG